jgi:L-alanine-DL-glutamate epimerase-like enolase superfamily enzyme
MFEETLMIEDGKVGPSDRPGMGITLNEKALAPHRIA